MMSESERIRRMAGDDSALVFWLCVLVVAVWFGWLGDSELRYEIQYYWTAPALVDNSALLFEHRRKSYERSTIYTRIQRRSSSANREANEKIAGEDIKDLKNLGIDLTKKHSGSLYETNKQGCKREM